MILVYTYGDFTQDGWQYSGISTWSVTAPAVGGGGTIFDIFSSPVIEAA